MSGVINTSLEAERAWPPIMPTRLAAIYTSVSPSWLIRAADRGELVPYGKRGRTFTWARSELDRWLRGAPVAAAEPSAQLKPSRAAKRDTSAIVSAGLERIRRAARGGS